MHSFEKIPINEIKSVQEKIFKKHPFLEQPFHGDDENETEVLKVKKSFISEVPKQKTAITTSGRKTLEKFSRHLPHKPRFGQNPFLRESIAIHEKAKAQSEKESVFNLEKLFSIANGITKEDWAIGFMMLSIEEQDDITMAIHESRGVTMPEKIKNDPNELINFFDENEIELTEFLPVSTMLDARQISELEKLGFSPQLTLKEIRRLSEEEYKFAA